MSVFLDEPSHINSIDCKCLFRAAAHVRSKSETDLSLLNNFCIDNEQNTFSIDRSTLDVSDGLFNLNLSCLSINESEGGQCDNRKTEKDLFNVQSEDAFEEWLVAKRNVDKLRRKSKIVQRRHSEINEIERAHFAQNSFDAWMAKKTAQRIEEQRIAQKKSQAKLMPVTDSRNLDDRVNFECWLEKKEKHVTDKKKRLKEENMAKRQQKLDRKQLSERLYKRWMAQAKTRGKPVPPSQGLLSLRGCVAQPNTNPVEWL